MPPANVLLIQPPGLELRHNLKPLGEPNKDGKVDVGRKISKLFGSARTEWGHLANPQLAWHSYGQEPVAVLLELQRQYEAI